jgi:hypothetical protein
MPDSLTENAPRLHNSAVLPRDDTVAGVAPEIGKTIIGCLDDRRTSVIFEPQAKLSMHSQIRATIEEMWPTEMKPTRSSSELLQQKGKAQHHLKRRTQSNPDQNSLP